MTMAGPIEEAGSTTRSLITALSGNPTQLGMLVLIFGLLAFFFYAQREAGKFRETMMQQVLDNSKIIHGILLERSITCPPGRTELEQPHKTTEVVTESLKPLELPSLTPQVQP
jgi:hypothetical protein